MIKIIGTTHIDSKEKIINEIKEFNPDIIAVELCELRFNLLGVNIETEYNKDESILGKISESIKEKTKEQNLNYGSDMITASNYAKENKIKLEFIDRSILDTQYLMSKIPQEELNGFLIELQKFQEADIKKELEKLDEKKLLNELKNKYPVSYEFLVNGRDLFMANKILRLIKNNEKKKILVFVGKGHLNKIEELIK